MPQNTPQEKQTDESAVDPLLTRPGALTYLEIPAKDAAQSAAFYHSLLGWKLEGEDPAHPKFSDPTGHLIGRWIEARAISRPPGFLPYFYVDRIHDVVTRVVPAGGEISKPPYREGNLWIAIIRDPAGNVIGLWQEDKP